MRNALRAAVAALLLLLLAAPLAEAHASRLPGSETPEAGARLTSLPAEVVLTVTEPVEPDATFLRVTRSDGVRIDVGGTRITDAASNTPRLAVSLRSDAGDGAYTVTLQTLSTADGHPWTESFGFAVGDFEPPAVAADGGVPVQMAVGRFAAFAGLALGFGAALFLGWMRGIDPKWPARFVHEALLGAGILHTVGVLVVTLSTAHASGLPFANFAASDVGRLLLVRLLLGLGALVLAAFQFSALTRTRSGPAFAVGLLLLAGLGSSRLGHASVQGVAGVAVDYMHLLATATWAGGLLVLLWVLSNAAGRLTVDDVRRAGLRFGTAALTCLIVLALTGLAATVLIVGPRLWSDPAALLTTAWGKFLAGKVVLTVAMVGLAGVNRLVFLDAPRTTGLAGLVQRASSRVWSGARSLATVADARALRRVIFVEALTGLLVLALAGALTSVSPPTDADAADLPVLLTGSGEAHHVALTIDPRPGIGTDSALTLVVQTHTGQTVAENTCAAGRTDCITATLATAGAANQTLLFTPDGKGAWTSRALWTQAGNATMTLRIQTAEVFGDTIPLEFAVP